MRKRAPVCYMMILIVLIMGICCSCQSKNKKVERVKDLEFTVVPDQNVPKEMLQIINEKKESPFKLKYTSTDNEFLYIVVGYGAQNTGGYSISVDDLYLTTNAIYIDTNLIGPSKNEEITMVSTYPYVVVKLPYQEENVVFR